MHRALKRAEQNESNLDDVEIALAHTEPGNVLNWLQTELPPMLENLLELVKPRLPDMQFRGPNQSDARDVLMDAQGDFDLAIELLVTKRHSLIDRLMDEGMFTEEQVIQVSFYLLTHPKCLANF